jgi:hypothetical protein
VQPTLWSALLGRARHVCGSSVRLSPLVPDTRKHLEQGSFNDGTIKSHPIASSACQRTTAIPQTVGSWFEGELT